VWVKKERGEKGGGKGGKEGALCTPDGPTRREMEDVPTAGRLLELKNAERETRGLAKLGKKALDRKNV